MPHPAALQQVPEHMLMEMACRPARRREAVLAASHIRSRDVASTMLVSAGKPCLPQAVTQSRCTCSHCWELAVPSNQCR